MQSTQKIVINTIENERIKGILERKDFIFFNHQHASWRANDKLTTAIFYKNGTFLLQGEQKSIDFLLKIVSNSISPVNEAAVLGLDESGKGDYFGPLVLAGAVISKENCDQITTLGVMDSKKLTDPSITNIFSKLKEIIYFKIRIIEPDEYNRLYREHKNLNHLMASEYKNLIGQFNESKYNKIILDKFSASEKENEEIKKASKKEFIIVERAEKNISVAAASIIARFYFIDWLEKCSQKLPKGSGKEAGELFSRLKNTLNQTEFEKIAKAHFKEQNRQLSLY